MPVFMAIYSLYIISIHFYELILQIVFKNEMVHEFFTDSYRFLGNLTEWLVYDQLSGFTGCWAAESESCLADPTADPIVHLKL